MQKGSGAAWGHNHGEEHPRERIDVHRQSAGGGRETISTPRRDGKPIVLIAEDDLDDRFLLEMIFRDFENSLEVKFVRDGQDLMEYLRAQEDRTRLGLILLDLNMPKVDGWQALREIKGRADLKNIPIVVWTTSSEEEDKTFCAEIGVAGFVTKPANFLELNAAIKEDCRNLPLRSALCMISLLVSSPITHTCPEPAMRAES